MSDTTKAAWELTSGDVITRNPEQPGQAGTWTVTGRAMHEHTTATIPVAMRGGGEYVFVCDIATPVTVREPATYRLAATLTDTERSETLLGLSDDARMYLLGTLAQRFPEVFDAALTHLDRKTAAMEARAS